MPQHSHPALTALTAVLDDAARTQRVPAEEIAVELMEATVWPDTALGLPGSVGGRALTPGYLVRLADGTTYRTDEHGNVGREGTDAGADVPSLPTPDTEIRLRYTVEGGISGRTRRFETDSEQLSEDDEAELRRLIEAADFFDVPNVMPSAVVYDGMTSTLWIAVGRRNHQVVRGDGYVVEDSEAFAALVAWAADRTPPMFPLDAVELP